MHKYENDIKQPQKSDVWLLHEAINVCEVGKRFYQQCITKVEDYHVKRAFIHMEEVRTTMLKRLAFLFKQYRPQAQAIAGRDNKPVLQQHYQQAASEITQNHMTTALSVLVKTEQQALFRLKQAAKSTNNKQLAAQLAEGIAWLQIGCDYLKRLNMQYASAGIR
ncbi:hypothetical protein [Shewanella gaetbuli]